MKFFQFWFVMTSMGVCSETWKLVITWIRRSESCFVEKWNKERGGDVKITAGYLFQIGVKMGGSFDQSPFEKKLPGLLGSSVFIDGNSIRA